MLRRVKPHLVYVLHDVSCMVARDVERVEAEDGARQRREGDVQVDAQLLPARRVHEQVVVLLDLKVVGHLDDGQHSNQERARDRDGGARERALPELRQCLRIDVEGGEPHGGASRKTLHSAPPAARRHAPRKLSNGGKQWALTCFALPYAN